MRTRTASFPVQYRQLCEAVGIQGKTVRAAFTTHTKAHSARANFYRYRVALRKEAPANPELQALLAPCEAIMVQLCEHPLDGPREGHIHHVTYSNRDNGPEAVDLQRALEGAIA